MRLNKKQKQYLKKCAHSIHPTVTIGKNGLTKQVIQMINSEMAAHELLKIKILDTDIIPTKEAATIICEKTAAELIDRVGKTIVLFKNNKENSETDINACGLEINRSKLAKLK